MGGMLCACRRRDAVEKAVAELTAKGYTVGGCACHVGSKEQRKRFIEEAVKVCGGVIKTPLFFETRTQYLSGKVKSMDPTFCTSQHQHQCTAFLPHPLAALVAAASL